MGEAAERLLTAAEVMKRTGLGKSKAYDLMHKLGPVRIDRSVRVRAAKLDAYLELNEEAGWQGSTDEQTPPTGGAGATPSKAKSGSRARSRPHSEQRRRLRELSSGSD